MQTRRLTFWGFAFSLLLLALFVQVKAIKAMNAMFAVGDQSDRVLLAKGGCPLGKAVNLNEVREY